MREGAQFEVHWDGAGPTPGTSPFFEPSKVSCEFKEMCEALERTTPNVLDKLHGTKAWPGRRLWGPGESLPAIRSNIISHQPAKYQETNEE